MKSLAQLREEADQALRLKLMEAGVPAHRVKGGGIRQFSETKRISLSSHDENRNVLRVCYPHTVDKWLLEGGPGFEEPQKRAIEHCRALWACAGSAGRQVANYDGMGGGDSGRERDSWSQIEALAQLAEYQKDIPAAYWTVFEHMARDDFGAGEAGRLFAGNTPQRIAHAKASVGFVASMIAMWRRY